MPFISDSFRSLTPEEYEAEHDRRIRQMAIDGGCETEAEILEWMRLSFGREQNWNGRPVPYRFIREARRKADIRHP